MSRVRELDRKAAPRPVAAHHATVLLIEDSVATATLLRSRLEAEVACQVQWCATYADARALLAQGSPTLAIAGYDLPDAPRGEALHYLVEREIPTVLFTARLEPRLREEFAGTSMVDYFLKDSPDTVDAIVQLVQKFLRNRAVPVLVVDDSRAARSPLIAILRRQNYHTIEASSAREALAILASNEEIELVITDYHMPDGDGLELTRQILRLRAPDRVRIIGISASSDPSLSAFFLKAGASDFIYRPFVAEEVWYRIANGLETLAQIRRLRYLAERDPLTGLYNRRAFFEMAQSRLGELSADSWGNAGAVAILDIDHFKLVNDTYGHDIGDTVIRQVAGVLGRVAHREKFLTARFGGEEFVLLMPGFEIAQVHALCEEIRQAVAALEYPTVSDGFGVTVSLGVARIQLEEGIDNNLNAADQMLYLAKGGGRNQVFSDACFARLDPAPPPAAEPLRAALPFGR